MATLEPLATIDDLENRGLPMEPRSLADSLLESVSSAVREAAGCPITRVSADINLAGTWEQFLSLPVGPVTAVTEVQVDGKPVSDWKLRDGRLWRAGGWGAQHRDISMTVTYGYATVPADIVTLVCSFVGAGMIASQDGDLVKDLSLAYTSIDDFREGYRTGDSEIVDVTELPARVKNSLRARFASQTYVNGGY